MIKNSPTLNYEAPFRLLHPECKLGSGNLELGVGQPPTQSWQPIADCRLLIIVGVTGVGKSTTVDAMQARSIDFALLPNRRTLTDELIIAKMQESDGDAITIERDRRKRFEYTRRYQQLFAGGMAHALSQLSTRSNKPEKLLLFDGLRGVNEIGAAMHALPKARFLALTAPDLERLKRLCGRNDAFDQLSDLNDYGQDSAQKSRPMDGASNAILAEAGLDAANVIFEPPAREMLAQMVVAGAIPLELLRNKLAIVVEERRNYDPAATVDALRANEERALIVDTMQLSPKKIAEAVAERLVDWWS